jgi:hypothetical protein
MNAKKYLVAAAIVLSAVLLALAASSFWQTKPGDHEPGRAALTGPGGKFGPVIETVVPAAKTNGTTDMLDLETGRVQPLPPFEYFNSRADVIMAWIRSNGLDISCSVWPNGAACVTHDMIIVAVDGECWKETTEQELIGNPALASGRHSPRRMLVLGHDRPDTYVFRTGEGTLGMLRIVGLSRHGRGVNICYKLINPAKSLSVRPVVASKLSEP